MRLENPWPSDESSLSRNDSKEKIPMANRFRKSTPPIKKKSFRWFYEGVITRPLQVID